MSSSMCPHLVQEYFERVAEILMTYRPQILKLVEYDKISENLVLRGAIRQEEHERIDRCRDSEGQVSQMLVVIQNRMWGLENLLAAVMEENVSTWLAQEMFRAYMEHLVHPLKKLQESPMCQCILTSSSVLYKGWVKALKSLDTLILRAGNSLGFMKQTMYPTDNMLTFLSEKLAEYTGGDSQSEKHGDELVPYGFASNASGEVQVAELEDDDICDLIGLSETLSIAYHPNESEKFESKREEQLNLLPEAMLKLQASASTSTFSKPGQAPNVKGFPTMGKPALRRSLREKRNSGKTSPDLLRRRSKSISEGHTECSSDSNENKDKMQRQKQLVDRLSTPKSATSTSSVRRRNGSFSDCKSSSQPGSSKPVRPRSVELQRSASLHSPTSSSATSKTSSVPTSCLSSSRSDRRSTTGKTTGFVRSRSTDPTSTSKPKLSRPTSRPTAVAKPNLKSERGTLRQEYSKNSFSSTEKIDLKEEPNKPNVDLQHEKCISSEKDDPEVLNKVNLFPDSPPEDDLLDDLHLPEMSSLFLSKSGLLSKEEHVKNLGYYQLNFDNE